MKILRCIMIGGAILAPAVVQAGATFRLQASAYGCLLLPEAKRLRELGAKDPEAAAKYLTPRLQEGSCADIAKDTIVEIEGRDEFGACLRPKGSPSCFWVRGSFAEPEAATARGPDEYNAAMAKCLSGPKATQQKCLDRVYSDWRREQ